MNRRLALAAALVAAASLPGHAAEKRAFTIADLYRVEGVSEPAVALDGRSVAFVVTTTDLPKIERHSRVWRVDADGSNPRALTATEGRDWSPAFSPDGTVLAFLSSRAGAPQVFFLPTAGGEAEKKTDFPGGVGAFLFAPDGRRLVFTAEVWPDCGADAACNRRKDETVEQGKMKVHVADHLLFRHWDAWEGSPAGTRRCSTRWTSGRWRRSSWTVRPAGSRSSSSSRTGSTRRGSTPSS